MRKGLKRSAGVIVTPPKARNPIDLYPDMLAHGFEKTATEISGALLEDNRVHGIIFISSATIGVEPYEPLIDMVKEGMTKPVLFSLFGEKDKVDALTLLLDGHHIPAYLFPETASKVFANMYRHAFKTRQASGS